ncbi:MAG: AAA family ATPase [Clostridiales bacterium]|jgi:hemerythrin-like metal-binding protein|nr:AAA family ATPase [Clostridiales bacterium]
MQLLRYRIKNFRAVVDTGWIQCRPVTAFVGSNESGKTTILMALMKLMDPAYKPGTSLHAYKSNIGNLCKLNLSKDVPIDREQEIMPVFKETVFIEAALSADDDIIRAFKALDERFTAVYEIHITKTLGGTYDLPGLFERFDPSLRDAVLKIVLSHLPIFLYFKEVTEFKSDINLSELAYKLAGIRKNTALTPRESIFFNLLNYLDIWESNLLKSIQEIFGDMRSVAEKNIDFVKIFAAIPLFKERFSRGFANLTLEFRKWWGNDEITIGYEVYKKGIRIRLRGKDGKKYLLENRSTGFRRFFALFLSFSVTAQQDVGNTVMLFDEAGAALHPIMQKKLARFFRELGKNTQILYNTHTSYMVPVTEMNSVRIVYKDADNHIQTNSVMRLMPDRANEESLHVVEASLAMHLAKSTIIGCLPIVVLNPEDMYYLQMIKDILIAKGKLNTVYELVIFCAGENGIDSMSELYGADGALPCLLLPSDKKGREIKKRLSEGMFVHEPQKLFELSDFTAKKRGLLREAACLENILPPKMIRLFAEEALKNRLGTDFTYDARTTLLAQINAYAAKRGFALPQNFRAELAREVKLTLVETYRDMHIPHAYLSLWKRIMKTLIKDHSRAGIAFADEEESLAPAVEWRKEYELGQADLDARHERIFQALNTLRGVVASNETHGVADAANAVLELVRAHAIEEEKYMAEVGFPGYERHKVLHDGFAGDAAELLKELEARGKPQALCVQLYNRLSKRLVDHAVRDDWAVGSHVREQGTKKEGTKTRKKAVLPTAENGQAAQKERLFMLSRSDITDYIGVMRENKERFPVPPFVKEKTAADGFDYLMCGEHSFAVMYGQDGLVLIFLLRLPEDKAARIGALHPLKKETFLKEDNWYSLTIDRTFKKKTEIYDILWDCYDFTLRVIAQEGLSQRSSETVNFQNEIEKHIVENVDTVKGNYLKAEREYAAALAELKEAYAEFRISRSEIAKRMRALAAAQDNADINVIERPKQPQLPMSLRYREKTFGMLYSIETGVLMVLRMSRAYAEELSARHPELCRAQFPAGPNWYSLPVDGAFEDKAAVYRVLDHSLDFVKAFQRRPAKKKEPQAARQGEPAQRENQAEPPENAD